MQRPKSKATRPAICPNMAGLGLNGVPGRICSVNRVSLVSGLTAGVAGGGTLASLQWTSTAKRLALLSARAVAVVITPFTAAQEIMAQAFIARAFTVADSSGSPANTWTAGQQSLGSANFDPSVIADLRVAGAAALTAGTRTLDSQAFLTLNSVQALAAASAANAPVIATYEPAPHRYPLILQANEGIVLANEIGLGAGGTVRWTWELEWAEFIPVAG